MKAYLVKRKPTHLIVESRSRSSRSGLQPGYDSGWEEILREPLAELTAKDRKEITDYVDDINAEERAQSFGFRSVHRVEMRIREV